MNSIAAVMLIGIESHMQGVEMLTLNLFSKLCSDSTCSLTSCTTKRRHSVSQFFFTYRATSTSSLTT
jgi:hypothetical protein